MSCRCMCVEAAICGGLRGAEVPAHLVGAISLDDLRAADRISQRTRCYEQHGEQRALLTHVVLVGYLNPARGVAVEVAVQAERVQHGRHVSHGLPAIVLEDLLACLKVAAELVDDNRRELERGQGEVAIEFR